MAIIFMIRRNLRSRRIRAETLWVIPVILTAIAALTIYQAPPHDAVGVAIVAAGAVGGAVAGWYRGKFTHITLDSATGVLTGKGSVIGLVLILALLMGRYAVRAWAQTHPDKSGIAIAVTDAVFLFGFATLIVARLEMWLRCRKLMASPAQAA
ncbi:MAG TPA: hypothetical protein VGM25_04475 [Caulobacteraceae bacterium]